MLNSIESTSKQNFDRYSLVENVLCCFIDRALLIDNAFLNKKEVYSKTSKI